MKSIRGSIRNKKGSKSGDEKKELLSSSSNNPSYESNVNANHGGGLKRSATLPSRVAGQSPTSTERTRKISVASPSGTRSPTSPRTLTRKISHSPSSKDPYNVDVFNFSSGDQKSLSPSSSPMFSRTNPDLGKCEFEKLPFNSYTTHVRVPWKESIQAALFVIFLSMVVPSPVVFIICILIKVKTDVRNTKAPEREKRTLYCIIVLTASIIRDILLIVIGVSFSCQVPIPSPALAYPALLFILSLCLLIGPFLTYYNADARHVYNFSLDKDRCLEILRHFSYESVREAEMNKLAIQEKRFVDQYPKLSSLSTWRDEYNYVKDVLNRKKLFASLIFAVGVCFLRFFIIMMMELFNPRLRPIITLNGTSFNTTDLHALSLYSPILITSSMVSLVLSVLFAACIMYVIFWGVALIREWRYFNENEADDAKTFIGGGPQSVGMWWKIRETLLLFSYSSTCFSTLMTRILFYTSAIFIVMLSLAMMAMTSRQRDYLRRSTIVSMIIDNLLLYVFVSIVCGLTNMIKKERTMATSALELKKINVGYEIACVANLDQESAEKESNIRNRVRLLRGKLALLQDLVSVVVKTDQESSCDRINIATFLMGCLVLVSSVYASR